MIQIAYTILKMVIVLVGIIGRANICERESMNSEICKSLFCIIVLDVKKSFDDIYMNKIKG